MEQEIRELISNDYDDIPISQANVWVGQIKMLISMIPDEETKIPTLMSNPPQIPQPKLNPPTTHTKALRIEDNFGEKMVLCEGGNNCGVMVPVQSKMPVGAKTAIMGQVYILQEEGKLLYSKEETEKMVQQNSKKILT